MTTPLDRLSEAPPQREERVSLGTRVLQGIGLVWALTLFSMGFRAITAASSFSFPEIRVLVGLALALAAGGAAGGVTYYYTEPLRRRGGWWRTLANVLSLLAYCLLLFGLLLLAMAKAG